MKPAMQVFPCEFVEKFGTRATKKRKGIEAVSIERDGETSRLLYIMLAFFGVF